MSNLDLFTNIISNIFQIDKAVIKKIYPEFDYLILSKNEYFIMEGSFIKKLGIVADGLFKISFLTMDGNEYIKYFLSNYDVLLGSLDTAQKSIVSIQAIQKSSLFVIDYKKFLTLCEEHSSLKSLQSFLINKYWSLKEKREMNMLANDAKKNYEIFKKEYIQVLNKIPQYYIAMYLGITPTQLSRIKNENYQHM